MMNMIDEIDEIEDPIRIDVSLTNFLEACDVFSKEAAARGLPASVVSRFDDARFAAKELLKRRVKQMGKV